MSNEIKFGDSPEIIKSYLFYMLTIKGRSVKTVNGYFSDLTLLFKYLFFLEYFNTSDKDVIISEIDISSLDVEFIKKVTLSKLYEFINYIAVERGNKTASRARKISAIKNYFNYLSLKTGIISDNPAKGLEAPSIKKALPKYLNIEESKLLLSSVDGNFEKRDFCIITLFLNCGMRLSELVGINLTDISQGKVRILGKGNKERFVYLNNACQDSIKDYLDFRSTMTINHDDRDALFISRIGRRLSPRRVEEIVEMYIKKSGLDGRGYSVHKLRHTAATLMYQHGGADIRVLKDVLGHANISTTEIYTHVSNEQVEKTMSSSPLSDFKKEK